MSRLDTVEVHLAVDDVTLFVGRAQFHRGRGSSASTTFQYEPDYIADGRAYPVDPALPLVSGTLHVTGLPGAFGDSAPNRWGRGLVDKRERALARRDARVPRRLDDVDYLTGVSDTTRQGALRFRAAATGPFLDPAHTVPRLVSLPALLRAADIADGDQEHGEYQAVKTLLDAGTGSLGGARPKASVLADDGRQLIAKFPHLADRWDVMVWESTALDLAAAAGVRVPAHRLTSIDGRHVLVLDRFDRHPARAGGTGRIGYMSAMTLLEQRDGSTSDYADIVERLPEISARATDDAHELFRRVALSVAMNNTDDHLRNHGFLRERNGWVLSPAFDLNPNPDQTRRQTTILGTDDADDAADALRDLASECRLAPRRAGEELSRIADVVERWRETATDNGASAAEVERFEGAFVAGVAILRRASR